MDQEAAPWRQNLDLATHLRYWKMPYRRRTPEVEEVAPLMEV